MQIHHANNFNLLRFFAAILVWYSHGLLFYGIPDRFFRIENLGMLSVSIFFIISGYFITASFDRNPQLIYFLRNRALRIFPAMVVVILLSVFLLGPLVTSLSLYAYFSHQQTWRYLLSLLVFPMQYTLPGVFTDSPALSVNFSLWTLPPELMWYIIIALLGVFGILRARWVFLLFFTLLILSIFGKYFYADLTPKSGVANMATYIKLGFFFTGGAFMYLARNHIPMKKKYFASAILILSAGLLLGADYILFDIALIYAVLYFGFLKVPLLLGFNKYSDISYGMYLYAFPVQQTILYFLGKQTHFILFMASSFCITFICAVISWHFIESPALSLKK